MFDRQIQVNRGRRQALATLVVNAGTSRADRRTPWLGDVRDEPEKGEAGERYEGVRLGLRAACGPLGSRLRRAPKAPLRCYRLRHSRLGQKTKRAL
jgi:hypothetical protein